MSIGLLLITHNEVGSALLNTASRMLGVCPLQTKALPVPMDSDPDQVRQEAERLVHELNEGDGVLVLTDMYGSTPSNIACSLQREGKVSIIAGVNLPMLIRILNYPQLDLAALTDKALSGGHTGILPYRPQS